MKLQNKKTGEIGDIAQTSADCIIVYYPIVDGVATNPQKRAIYNTLAELNSEWEDYEEPKEFWYICGFEVMPAIEGKFSTPDLAAFTREEITKLEDIGNYFETEEEAEKAVKKQVIWTTLEDSGFKFTGWKRDKNDRDKLIIEATDPMFRVEKDLDLLFGGEE